MTAAVLTAVLATGAAAVAPGASAIAAPPRTASIANWVFDGFDATGWFTWGVYETAEMARQAMTVSAQELADM